MTPSGGRARRVAENDFGSDLKSRSSDLANHRSAEPAPASRVDLRARQIEREEVWPGTKSRLIFPDFRHTGSADVQIPLPPPHHSCTQGARAGDHSDPAGGCEASS